MELQCNLSSQNVYCHSKMLDQGVQNTTLDQMFCFVVVVYLFWF